MKIKTILRRGLIPLAALLCISPVVAQNQFEVLVYTQSDQYHQESLPVGIQAFEKMAREHRFGLTWTMDAGIFTDEKLKDFATVVFFNSKPDQFSEEQKAAFQGYIRHGGGFVGIHVASTTEGAWPWYNRLVGRIFTDHPRIQSGILEVMDPDFPATFHLPEKWIWTDEWYNFSEPTTEGLRDILKVDENSYEPTLGFGTPITGMGNFHPIAWYHEFDGGRSFYSALGHHPELYEDERHMEFIYGGIFWTATGRGSSADNQPGGQ